MAIGGAERLGPELGHEDPAAVSNAMSGLQLRVVALCFLFYLIDGADVLVVSYAAPALAADWKLDPGRLGLLFSAGVAGMTIGALALAPLADRIGRRTMTLLGLIMISAGMVGGGFAPNVEALMILRLFVGLGIGAMLASMTALAAEFAPDRLRAFSVTFATAGYPLGATLAGFAAAGILPHFGWQGLFFGAGLLSLVLLPLAYFGLPESLGFLKEKQPRGALDAINATRRKMAMSPLMSLPEPAIRKTGSPVSALLTPTFRASTLLVWGAFFGVFMSLYFLLSWIPKIAFDAGLPMDRALYAGAAFNFGSCIGVLMLGWLTTRLSLTKLIIWFFIAGALAMLLFSYAQASLLLAFLGILAVGFFIQGGFSGLYAVAAKVYPTDIRTTGVGWGLGAGRLGAILGPYLGGVLFANGATLQISFILFALPVLAAAILIWRLHARRAL